MKRIAIIIAGLFLGYYITSTLIDQKVKVITLEQQYTHKYDSLQNVSDSLYAELFPAQVELGRYQMAFEIFVKRNPKAAEEYSKIISDETE